MAVVNVLGLDGSLQNFGIAVGQVDLDSKKLLSVDRLVLSKTSKDAKAKRAEDDFLRFKQHCEEINRLIEEYKIQVIYGEIPSGSRDVRAAFAFGGVTAILSSLSVDLDVVTVSPSEVKVAATGSKHADKEDVIEEMHRLFPNADWLTSKKPNAMDIKTTEGKYLMNNNEHLADAIAVIYAGLKK